jgi:hypothetical protein
MTYLWTSRRCDLFFLSFHSCKMTVFPDSVCRICTCNYCLCVWVYSCYSHLVYQSTGSPNILICVGACWLRCGTRRAFDQSAAVVLSVI